MGTHFIHLVASIAVAMGLSSILMASSETAPDGRSGECPVSIPEWNEMEVHCGEDQHPVLCHFRIGRKGWVEEESQAKSSFPRYSLDIKILSGDFAQAARYGGFEFKQPFRRLYQTWPKPESTPVPPPSDHPNPEAARFWCTPSRHHESCGAEYISGETWTGYVIGASFGFHSSSGYGGSVEACRLIAQGPGNLFVVAEGIGGCHGLQESLDRVFEGYLGDSNE